MKKLITAAVLTLSMTGIAAADVAKAPTMMTDTQMDNVVAGGTLAEYGLLVSFMGLIAIQSVRDLGDNPDTTLGGINGQVDP